MIKLQISKIVSVSENSETRYVEHYLECENIYAYSLIKFDEKLNQIMYSLKNEKSPCGIRKYIEFADECTLIKINNEVIWQKDKEQIIQELLEDERANQIIEMLNKGE